ncbi:matrixin family metalloprotease [Burkholderia stagnalis]
MAAITGNEAFWGNVKLTPEELAYINDSNTLVDQLLQYQRDFSSSRIGAMQVSSGGGTLFNGSYVEFASNYAQWDSATLLGQLAHEIGHYINQSADRAFSEKYEVSPNSPDAYSIDAMIGLHREGVAVYNNYIVQQEISNATNGQMKIYLGGAYRADGTSTGLQQLLDAQHTFDLENNYTDSQDRNLMVAQAMGVYSMLKGSAIPNQTYYDYYGRINGAKVPAQAPKMIGSSFSDPSATGDIATVKGIYSTGEVETSYFSGGVISSSTVVDQFGGVISSIAYTHNVDGSYSARFTDAAGRLTDVQNVSANGSYSDIKFDPVSGIEVSQTNYNSSGVPIYKDNYNNSGQLVSEEGFNAAGLLVSRKVVTPGTLHIETAYFFDPATGKEIYEQHYDGSGNLTHQDDYNSAGQLVSEEGFNANGQMVTKKIVTPGTLHVETAYFFDPATGQETYEQHYDGSGRITHQDDYNSAGQLVSEEGFNANGQMVTKKIVTPGTTRVEATYFFDPATGNETREQHFDASGNLLYQSDYNAAGQLITEEVYNSAGREIMQKIVTPGTTHVEKTVFFDANTGKVSSISNYDASGKEITRAEYNADGLRTVDHTFDTMTGVESQRAVYTTPGSTIASSIIDFDVKTGRETHQSDFDVAGNNISQEYYDPVDGNLLYKNILGGSVVTQQLHYTPGWQYPSEAITFLGDGREDRHYYFDYNGNETRESIFGGSSMETRRITFNTSTGKEVTDTRFYSSGGVQSVALYDPNGQQIEYDDYNTASQLINKYVFNPGYQYSYQQISFTAGSPYSSLIVNFNQNTGVATSWTQFDPNTGKALSSGANWNQFGQILNGSTGSSNVYSFYGGGAFPSGTGFIAFQGGSGSIFGGFGFSGASQSALYSDAVASTLLDRLDLYDTPDGQAAFGRALDDARAAANATLSSGTGRPNVQAQWSKSELTWSVSALDAAGHVFAPSTMSQYEQAIDKAFSAWSAQTGFVFHEVAAGTSADIQIDWATLDTTSTGVVGFTSGHTIDTTITDAHIRLEDPEQTALISTDDGVLTYAGTQATLFQTALHEIGHALGLGDTTDARSVMYYALTDENQTLDATDVLGAQAVGVNHLTRADGVVAQMIQSMASFDAAPSASMPTLDPVRMAVHPMLATPVH